MPLEKSVRLAVILGTIPDLAIRIKSSLFEKWVDLVKKVGGFKIFLNLLYTTSVPLKVPQKFYHIT
jgi:hypothetical protein